MTTITLEVPDELAARLDQLRDHLPALLFEVLNSETGKNALRCLDGGPSDEIFDEMIDFLATGPTAQQIIAHKASEAMQTRLRELLDKNREEGLNESESAELDGFESVEDLMGLLKAKARCVITAKHSADAGLLCL